MTTGAADVDLTQHVAGVAAELRAALHGIEVGGDPVLDEAVVQALAAMVEVKDSYTRSHLDRTHDYARALALRVDPELAADPVIGYGFLLHDVGKVGVPEAVLCKPAPLDAHEWSLMRGHPALGAALIAGVPSLDRAVPILRHHHERWDGAGYPDGLAGEDIPLAARIFAVVDSFDAMTSERPYRRAMPVATALAQLRDVAGSQLDPRMVAEFLELADELRDEGRLPTG
jgi:HD-GYP domain-containing protein (c-di-GMP phosphodiesterase class II)